tara:strand:- start:11590 stop:13278 length:1689 start_codon:yes stop_codon:yes gene_type:complete
MSNTLYKETNPFIEVSDSISNVLELEEKTKINQPKGLIYPNYTQTAHGFTVPTSEQDLNKMLGETVLSELEKGEFGSDLMVSIGKLNTANQKIESLYTNTPVDEILGTFYGLEARIFEKDPTTKFSHISDVGPIYHSAFESGVYEYGTKGDNVVRQMQDFPVLTGHRLKTSKDYDTYLNEALAISKAPENYPEHVVAMANAWLDQAQNQQKLQKIFNKMAFNTKEDKTALPSLIYPGQVQAGDLPPTTKFAWMFSPDMSGKFSKTYDPTGVLGIGNEFSTIISPTLYDFGYMRDQKNRAIAGSKLANVTFEKYYQRNDPIEHLEKYYERELNRKEKGSQYNATFLKYYERYYDDEANVLANEFSQYVQVQTFLDQAEYGRLSNLLFGEDNRILSNNTYLAQIYNKANELNLFEDPNNFLNKFPAEWGLQLTSAPSAFYMKNPDDTFMTTPELTEAGVNLPTGDIFDAKETRANIQALEDLYEEKIEALDAISELTGKHIETDVPYDIFRGVPKGTYDSIEDVNRYHRSGLPRPFEFDSDELGSGEIPFPLNPYKEKDYKLPF